MNTRAAMIQTLSDIGYNPAYVGYEKPEWYGVMGSGKLIGKYPDWKVANHAGEGWCRPDVWVIEWERNDFRVGWDRIPDDVLTEIYIKIMMEGI